MTSRSSLLQRSMPGLALRIVVLALGLGAVAPAVAAAQTIGYTFTKIAETTAVGSYVEFFSPVVIDDGRVFFVAETSSGERVILSGAGGALTTVIDTSLPGLTFFEDSSWDVNNAGTVAFIGTVNGETNAFTTALAGLTAINDPTDPNGVTGVAGFAIGNSGNVVVSDLTRMSLGNGGPLSLLLDAANDPSLPSLYTFLTINTNDVVAFIGHTATGFAVYKVTSAGTLATIGSLPETVGGAPQINDSGVVAFYRRTAASGPGTRAIVVGSGGSLLTVADNTTAFTEFGAPGINNSGALAFLALTPGLPGIPVRIGAFTGPNPIGDRVLRTGDPLFGSTVTGMLGATVTDSLGRAGLNNSGQIAFLAVLADGRRLVVRANPGAAPNAPPVVTNPGDQMVTRDQAITPLHIQASDPDGGNVLTYQASGLPPGLTINTSTGVITGTPGPTSAGQWTTTLNVSDGRAGTLATFVWTVVATVTPAVQFDRTTYTVGEAAGNATITVTRTGPTTNAVTVQYATSPGTATEGADYTPRSGTLTIGAGLTSTTFTVPIAADALIEAPETLNLALSNPSGATLGAPNTAVLTITDGANGGSLRFSAATYTAAEPPGPPGVNLGFVTITLMRDGLATNIVTVDYATSNGTATAGTDYAAVSGTLTILANQRTATFAVVLFHDTLAEGNETVNLALANPTGGAVLGTQSTAVLTITGNGVGGTLQLSAAAYSVSEAGGQATIKVNRTGGAASGVTVQYATSDGTAVAGTDYTTTTGTLTFGANETTKTFTVPILDNGVADGNRKFTVGLTAPGGGGVLGVPSTSTAAVTIVDDEVGVRFSTATYTVGEAGPAATITVVRTGPPAPVVTVKYATSDGTATAGQDYTARSGTLTFGPNVTTASFLVPILPDALVEGPETVTMTLSSPTGALLGTPSVATLTITDNDAGGAFQFSAATYSVTEPVSGATPVAVTITVTRTVPVGMTPGMVTVDYATSDGTATAGVDYTATAGTLTFPVGALSRTFTVTVLHDTLDELNETVNLTLSNPTGGGTLGVRSTAVLTINDND